MKIVKTVYVSDRGTFQSVYSELSPTCSYYQNFDPITLKMGILGHFIKLA